VISQVLFFYFAGMIVLGAIGGVASPHMIYSVLSLLVAFVHIAGIYILLHAEFIAAIQIIIYAGAILVLYLFVLMLFNPKTDRHDRHRQAGVGLFLGVVLLGLMFFAAYRPQMLTAGGEGIPLLKQGHIKTIGEALFTDYIFAFEIASLILLVAMLGAIILTLRGKRPERALIPGAPASRNLLRARTPIAQKS